MNKRLKVLHILWSGGIGGTEEYVVSLFKYFDNKKYESFLCFLSQKGPIFEDALKITDNVIYIGMNNGIDVGKALKILRLLRNGQFDIIHSHSTNLLTNIIISFFKKPAKIFSDHISPGAKDAYEKRKLFYKVFPNLFQKIIAISESVKQKLVKSLKVNPQKIVVVHNGVRIDKFNSSLIPPQELVHIKKSGKYILGFIGRMEEFKRPDLFVEIAAELIKKDKSFSFIMVGDGSELDNCKSMIQDHEIGEYFNVLGFRRDIPNILKLFDALLFTSDGEGFGIVIIEAMAMGVPVFAINDGAVKEIINHKENGIILDTSAPELITQKIIENIEDRKLMNKIRKQCVKDVHSKFAINLSAQQIEDVYEKVLHSRKDTK